ncbi:transporter [Achromobacter sp. AONIH1]|uniref:transporter n=1 Tax=Achromobacter sp. AONIH1 TaxID=1758194 RepID=UPI000CD06AF9|nr:transporter [Achromobacter sp. AONIH1]AUT49090.1 transporter [Achromobacter sp. AONIH1]
MAGKIGFRSRAGAAFALACAGALQAAWAGDPSARDWIPAPVGTNIIAGYMAGLRSSGVYAAGKRADGVSVDVDMLIYRQMHYRDFYGKTVQLEFIVPMSRTTQEAPGAPRDRKSGIGDVTLGSAIWLYNNDQTKTWFAWEPFITVPVGRYDGSRPDVSPGKNRWSTVQDFSFVQGVGESTFLEAIAEVEIYGRNTDWFGQTLKKDPSLRLFALASTNLTENTYTGVRYRYETGGRERSGGQTVTSRARNHQLALELTHQINPSNQIQLQYIHDLKVENGPRMRGVQMRYVYAF